MWRKNYQENIIVHTMDNEFSDNVIIIFIIDKMILSCHFIMCFGIKISFQSVQSMFILCSFFWIAIKSPIVMNTDLNSLSEQIFHFENDKRRDNTFINTNTLHYHDSFLTLRLYLKFLINMNIDNISLCFFLINYKSTFVHIVYIFWFDIELHQHLFQIIKSVLQLF